MPTLLLRENLSVFEQWMMLALIITGLVVRHFIRDKLTMKVRKISLFVGIAAGLLWYISYQVAPTVDRVPTEYDPKAAEDQIRGMMNAVFNPSWLSRGWVVFGILALLFVFLSGDFTFFLLMIICPGCVVAVFFLLWLMAAT
jgi:hypothetical protein